MTYTGKTRTGTKKDFERVAPRLDRYNSAHGAPYKATDLCFQIHDKNKKIVAEAVGKELWGVLEVILIATKEEHRGKGAGTALIREIEKSARKRGLVSIWLWTTNWQGEGWYEKQGFVEMDRLPMKIAGRPRKKDFMIFYRKTLKR